MLECWESIEFNFYSLITTLYSSFISVIIYDHFKNI